MKTLKLKGIVVVTALTIVLSGCQLKEENQINNIPNNSSQTQIETTIQEEPTYTEETTTTEEPTTTEEYAYVEEENTVVEEQLTEFTFFEDAKQELITYIESEDFQQLKEKGKYYITTAIDFIFYDQPINGIYFDQMTEELKKDIIRDVKALDEAIMAYYPDYKEDVSSKYQIAADFISEKYLDVMDAIKEYLGEENYNAVGEIKDQIKEDVSEKAQEGLEYIKDLYSNWKNK